MNPALTSNSVNVLVDYWIGVIHFHFFILIRTKNADFLMLRTYILSIIAGQERLAASKGVGY